MTRTLDAWQKAGDPNLFKLIVSPEFGERLDLKRHTRDLVAAMERDLGTPLQWAAVEHFNTAHPHVHLCVRGVDSSGQPLRIGREYIKNGIRTQAQRAATTQLGHRTEQDMKVAMQRQVPQQRFTELDRQLVNKAADGGAVHRLDYSGPIPKAVAQRERRLAEISRLQQLCAFGLASKTGPLTWEVSKSFEVALRNAAMATDRQRSLAAQRETVSDPRLPLVTTDLRTVDRLQGRVLGSGLDEASSRAYILIEGVDAKIHYCNQDAAIERARRDGKLRPGAFIDIERVPHRGSDGQDRVKTVVRDLGPAVDVLRNERHMTAAAILASKGHAELPRPSGLAGWVGDFHRVRAERATAIAAEGRLVSTSNGYTVAPRRSRGFER